MKVVLLQDIKGSGNAGEIVTVSDGYARNYLFPKHMAEPATKMNVNAAQKRLDALAHKKATEKDAAQETADKISQLTVTIKAKAGDGRLFGSVTGKEIASAVLDQHGIHIDRKKIMLEKPIHAAGEYTVDIKVYADIKASLKVEIVAVKGKEELG